MKRRSFPVTSEELKESRMENQAGRAEVPVTSLPAEARREAGNTTCTAQAGSIVCAPQLSGVHVSGDIHLIINHTYVQSPARTEQTNIDPLNNQEHIQSCQAKLKSFLKGETRDLIPGTDLNKIYTELNITGDSGAVKINLNNIFRPLPNEDNPPRRVLMKGIAGIGKTVSVLKFTHDWARGDANQSTQFVFRFTFRELNSVREPLSLMELISHFFVEVKSLKSSDYDTSSLLFILDGLDESKFSLDTNQMCRSVEETTTVNVLLTNLIKGKLLPKASVWITSRPAVAAKIPSNYRVIEVRGFNDEQKKEYFLKKVCDEKKAQMIVDHLPSLTSLYSMCHIPVFCWISAAVFERLLTESDRGEFPKTLTDTTVTEMYTHFLIIQTKPTHEKDYQGHETNKDLIMKLGKLAFYLLLKDKFHFDESDLRSCQMNLKQAVVYSGLCTQIIENESGIYERKMNYFIDPSVQQFLAALYVLETFMLAVENLLKMGGKHSIKNAEDMALTSSYGQWDSFHRFLLELSRDENLNLLQKIFGFQDGQLQSVKYIHEKRKSLAYLLLVSTEDLVVFELKKYNGSEEVLERLLPAHKVSKPALPSDCELTDRSCSLKECGVTKQGNEDLSESDLSKEKLYIYEVLELLSDVLNRRKS
uniref:protein NLRC3-like n=1 Tax=Semicossyphus pulcher TaxID=241346 RepID=UPI0037E9C29F